MIQLLTKPVAEKLSQELSSGVQQFKDKNHRAPKLVVILVGDNPASVIYTSKKGEKAVQLGMEHETVKFPASVTPIEVQQKIQQLNQDPSVDGILMQRPLPPAFKESEAVFWISPHKDVDCFHPENVGKLSLGLPGLVSCTPAGVMEILRHYQIELSGKTACVIGRSPIVGKPMAALLLRANATLIQCHSQTPELHTLSSQADIVIAAAGKPKFFGPKYFKKGAVVVDVGIHRLPDGKLCGDVDYEAVAKVSSAITPVPGGVGPMTIVMLMHNTLQAALNPRSSKI